MSIDQRYFAAASAAGEPIEAAGSTWMLHPEQFEASTKAGYGHPFAGYFAGRGGVLGEVDAPVVTSVLAVFAPPVVEAMWDMGRPVHGARGGAELYINQAAEWARPRLADLAGLDRFVELAERVIAAAPSPGLPVFNGWRSLPRAQDSAGRAFQTVLILRELRGGIHLAAMTAAGLTPQEAHMLNKGEEYCRFFGWDGEMPEIGHLKDTKAAIEEQTNIRCAHIIAGALSVAEAEELADLAGQINARLS